MRQGKRIMAVGDVALAAVLVMASILIRPLPASADQLTATTPEFRVNQSKENNQVHSSVAVSGSGKSVVVWEEQNFASAAVKGRMFGPDGRPETDEFALNAPDGNRPFRPSVAMGHDGSFVAVWGAYLEGRPCSGVYFRRFGPDGEPLSETTAVETEGFNCMPSVAMNPDGRFVVAYEHTDAATGGVKVRCRAFDADGMQVGDTASLSMFSTCAKTFPSVAMDPDGGFAVAWVCGRDTEPDRNIMAARFSPRAELTGEPLRMNATSGIHTAPSAAAGPGGECVVAWFGKAFGGDDALFMRVLPAEGRTLPQEIVVNTGPLNGVTAPEIGVDGQGATVAVWQSYSGGEGGIFCRVIQPGPGAQGLETLVVVPAESSAYWSAAPDIAVNPSGEAVMAWESSMRDDSGMDVFARRFEVPHTGSAGLDAAHGLASAAGRTD